MMTLQEWTQLLDNNKGQIMAECERARESALATPSSNNGASLVVIMDDDGTIRSDIYQVGDSSSAVLDGEAVYLTRYSLNDRHIPHPDYQHIRQHALDQVDG